MRCAILGRMDLATARSLSALTTDFYRRVSASFGATRQAPWPGWQRVLAETGLEDAPALSVLDLACGNLRFERYLAERGQRVHAWALDGCAELAREGLAGLAGIEPPPDVSLGLLDVTEALFAGDDLVAGLDVPPVDLSVCFGFMHHLPLAAQRARVLRALVSHTRPGGSVALTFWQLERSPRLAAKARPVVGGDSGDYLLGWQDRGDVARYCHSFSEDEVDALVEAVASHAREITRFSADGKTGDLNRYLLLQRR